MTPELVDQLVPSAQEADLYPAGLYELMRSDLVASCKFAAFEWSPTIHQVTTRPGSCSPAIRASTR